MLHQATRRCGSSTTAREDGTVRNTALEGLDADPILVVHDEIVMECAEADAEAAKVRLA